MSTTTKNFWNGWDFKTIILLVGLGINAGLVIGSVNSLSSTQHEIKQDVKDVKDDVGDIKTKVTQNKTKIDNLEKTVDKHDDKLYPKGDK